MKGIKLLSGHVRRVVVNLYHMLLSSPTLAAYLHDNSINNTTMFQVSEINYI